MDVWRLLNLDAFDAFMNMAIDEGVAEARIAGLAPNTVRFYRWKPSAVSIGRFQDVDNEVDVEACKKYGVDVVRRNSGGGAVYHDYDGEITYSVIVSERDLGSTDVVSTYNQLCSGIVEAVQNLGVQADFNSGDPKKCPNVTVCGRKISGNAQFRRQGVLLQHGTVLVDLDLKKMYTFLKVRRGKTVQDLLNIAEKKMTSIKHELKSNVSMKETCQALVKAFEKKLNIQLLNGKLTSHELNRIKKLYKEKYSTYDWNFRGKVKN